MENDTTTWIIARWEDRSALIEVITRPAGLDWDGKKPISR